MMPTAFCSIHGLPARRTGKTQIYKSSQSRQSLTTADRNHSFISSGGLFICSIGSSELKLQKKETLRTKSIQRDFSGREVIRSTGEGKFLGAEKICQTDKSQLNSAESE
jgi:hypothetical protein